MTKVIYPQRDGDNITVNLRNPVLAVVLAWIFPGAGHFYQRRFPKGFLFMIVILSTYFAGLALGEGRVVYASMRKHDVRWQYFFQAGVGLPAAPAIVQAMKIKDGGEPFFIMSERYPEKYSEKNPHSGPIKDFQIIGPDEKVVPGTDTYKDGLMAPPAGPLYVNENDVLGQWHYEMKHFFEIGTLFTVVAGLLNLLAMYDAFAGPAIVTPEEEEEMQNKKRRRSRG